MNPTFRSYRDERDTTVNRLAVIADNLALIAQLTLNVSDSDQCLWTHLELRERLLELAASREYTKNCDEATVKCVIKTRLMTLFPAPAETPKERKVRVTTALTQPVGLKKAR